MARVSMDMNYHPVEMSQLGEEINGEMSQLSGEMSQLGGRGDNEHNTQGISNEECFAKGDEMSQLGGEMSQLPEKVRIVREAKKVTEEYMEEAICDLCANGWITSVYMAEVLRRDKRTLLRILRPMVNHGLLIARYPNQLTHPQQAYKTPR